jgi:hypothetical protein
MIGVVISRDFQRLGVTFRDDKQFGVSGFWHFSTILAMRSEGLKDYEVHTDLMACLVYSGPRETMWWTADEEEITGPDILNQGEMLDTKFTKESCSTCSKFSSAIFKEAWVCTNMTCTALGNNHSGHTPPTQTYLQQFLQPWISQ